MERREDAFSIELKNILIQTLEKYKIAFLDSEGDILHVADGEWEVSKLRLLIELEKL